MHCIVEQSWITDKGFSFSLGFKVANDGMETLGSGDTLWNDHVNYETKFSATKRESPWSFRVPVRQ